MQDDSLFSVSSPAGIVSGHFDDGHSDWREVVSHSSFDLCSPRSAKSLVAQSILTLQPHGL